MTLISDLITNAYRESNLIAVSASPTTAEIGEGVTVLNQFLNSLFGHEAGQEFVDVSVAAATATLRPNERALVSYNTGNVTITLPATPDNGARVQVIDTVIGGSRTITIDPNGRKAAGAASVVLAAGSNKIYMYRADLGDWLAISPLASSDALPFPTDYEPLFIAAIAIRINDRHGQPVPEQLQAVFARDIERIKFDYRQHGQADEPRTKALLNRALNLAGLVPPNGQPRAAQLSDALRRLNVAISSLFGEELGELLVDVNLTSASDFDPNCFIPINTRLTCNLTSETTVKLHPQPLNGTRFAVIDVAGNFDTVNLIVDGNGRKIEGSTLMQLNVANIDREWFYRADIGQWVPLDVIELDDEPPFPEEFDQLLEIMVAVRLNPKAIEATLIEASRRMTAQFRNRYRQSMEVGSELALLRGYVTDRYYYSDYSDLDSWATGYPYRRY